ncbi:unnamed protein product [Parnassius apollo]|uniref:(apollo) hypothetical protein n=1 Tax=Parnassius apollo TaxID=110799 RepID=A0A8S3XSS2_PARAO|nr:unnamed protein product [Parnassius apollo]
MAASRQGSFLRALLCALLASYQLLTEATELLKDEVDNVIEDDITQKLSEDLLQSIERKFQVDLERSVDMVLLKIKLLLQNGTTHIQDSLMELQSMLDLMKKHTGIQVDSCLKSKQNDTSAMAEKALHQMVVCGYALIGQDPTRAVGKVVALKDMIKQGVKPINAKRKEIDALLKLCGHEHDSLKNVIKCVISKSPIIKASMMEITGKLIEGVVELTKLMAHGAMHEACLIEVVKTLEDEAFDLIKEVKDCAYGNNSYFDQIDNYLNENNATVLDIERKLKTVDTDRNKNTSNVNEMKEMLQRMVLEDKKKDVDKKLKDKLLKLRNDIKFNDANDISIKDT